MPTALRQGITIVIPVKGRVQLLAAALSSLVESRRRCPEPTQVIVVDDSEPADAAQHRDNCLRFDAQYLRGPRRVGAKRNAGAAAADYDLITFIDSDCQVGADFLAVVATALRESPPEVGAVAGPIEMTGRETGTLRLFRRTTELNQPFTWPLVHEQITWAATANFTVRAEVFHQLGGFAVDTLTVVGGEDVDLGVRMTKAGYVIMCCADAVVQHSRSTGDSVLTIGKRLCTYGRAANWLLLRHPERREFRLNPVALIAATGAVASITARRTRGRSGWAVAVVAASLLAQHAWRRRRSGDGPRVIGSLVASTVLDWSFDLGEFVGAWQVGRPQHLFSRFVFMDNDTFRPRTGAPDDRVATHVG
jgi:GT2 family glycosyltransferase